MEHIRKVRIFRREDTPVAPDLAMADCIPPADMGCEFTDGGGCQVFDYCGYDNTSCGGVYDFCSLTDSGGGCAIGDRCESDGAGGCIFDSCGMDDPYCQFLDYCSIPVLDTTQP